MAELLVFDRTTDAASSYRGPAERAVGSFKGPPEQLAPAGLMSQVLSLLVPSLRAEGADLLKMRVWADTSPTFYTRYRIELTAKEPMALAAQPGYAAQASPFPFLIVGAILLALGLLALTAWQVSRIEWGTAAGFGVGLWAVAAILGVVILGRGRAT